MLKHELNVLIGVAAAVAVAGIAIPSGIVLESFYRHTAIAQKGATMARVLSAPLADALARPDDPMTTARVNGLLAGLESARDAVGDARLDLDRLVVLDNQNRLVKATGEVDVRGLAQDRLIEKARVETEKDVLVDYPENKWGRNGEALVAFAVPLRRGGEPRGTLWFTLSLERARWVFWQTFAGVFAAIVAGAIAVWFVLYKTLKFRILRPIVELSQAIERVRGGDLGVRVRLDPRDEFGTLGASFDEMVGMMRERPLIDAKLDEAERIALASRRLAESHQKLEEAHKELHAAKEQLALREKQASFQRFVRSIAHELKNPLHSASAAIDPLARSLARVSESYRAQCGDEHREDLDDVKSALGILERSVARAVSIIHDLQGFAQLGAADLVEVELRRTIDDAALAVQPIWKDRIRLELDVVDEDGRPTIGLKAFPTLLAQAFVNLFANAAQAIEGAGKVMVRARRKGERVHIEVEDTGPGIPAEHRARLFEPFFTTKGVAGTGLGLALAYAYVEKHGGTIEAAKTEPGKGALFVIDLPVTPKPTGELGPKGSAIFEEAAARAAGGGAAP
jgi:signal transduction histidine kinase